MHASANNPYKSSLHLSVEPEVHFLVATKVSEPSLDAITVSLLVGKKNVNDGTVENTFLESVESIKKSP